MGSRKLTLALACIICLLLAYVSFKIASTQPLQIVPNPALVEVAENVMCGPAALQTVCRNLGLDLPVETIAKLAGITDSGTTMYGLAEAARQLKLNAVGRKLTLADLEARRKPLIAYLKPNHFIAVTSMNNKEVSFSDQSGNNLKMALGDFLKRWDGSVLIVTR